MDMRPNIPASQPSSSPTTERESQPMCQTDIVMEVSYIKEQLYLLTKALKDKDDAIDSLHNEVDTLKKEVDNLTREKEEWLTDLSGNTIKDRLLFNVKTFTRKEFYAWIIEGIKKGFFRNSLLSLCRFFAKYTNLGSVSTIRSQLYDYK